MVYVYVLNEKEFCSDFYVLENLSEAKRKVIESLCSYIQKLLKASLDDGNSTTLVISIRNPVTPEFLDLEGDYVVLSEMRMTHDNASILCRIIEKVERR